jgi:hypothetical protein
MGGGRRLDGDACPPPPPQRPARLTAGSGEESVSASASCSGVGSRPLFSIKARSFVLCLMNCAVASVRLSCNLTPLARQFPPRELSNCGVVHSAFGSANHQLEKRLLNFEGPSPGRDVTFPLLVHQFLACLAGKFGRFDCVSCVVLCIFPPLLVRSYG